MDDELKLEAFEIAEIFVLLGMYRQIQLADKVILDFENLKVPKQIYRTALANRRKISRLLNKRLEVDAPMTRVIEVFEQAKPYVNGILGL